MQVKNEVNLKLKSNIVHIYVSIYIKLIHHMSKYQQNSIFHRLEFHIKHGVSTDDGESSINNIQ